MLIDNESIIIIDGKAAKEIMSGEIKTELVQNSSAEGFAENSFVRNSTVIQCISPSSNDGVEKVKFSVMYKPAASLAFRQAAVVFSRETEGHYEIRSQNETVSEGECRMSAIRITMSDTDGKLNLEFSENSSSAEEDIRSGLNEISSENTLLQNELAELEKQYEEERRKNEQLISSGESVSEKISILRTETERLSRDLTELSELEARRDTLKKNLEENQINGEKTRKLSDQLRCFSEILEFYRNDEGFSTVSEKLVSVESDLRTICEHISELADKRSELTESLSEE